jgi:hypothetical protein
MIGPVSTTGKAMLESLQNAMSKGMPVEQAISYVKSLAMDGVAPLTDLYSMMLQFQRLKQPTRRPPEGGSIREQLESLRNPMEMGLGSMNAGAMENPSFAGGGIVAFDNGGAAQSAPAGITPQLYGPVPQFKTYDERAEFYNRLLQDPEFFKKQMAEREALAKEQGFDEFGQSFKLRESLLKEDQKRAETVAAEEAKYDEEEYWGDVASNAAESGATLLTSLAKAQKGKATRKRATAEKARMAVREAKNTEILLEQAREAEREGRYKDAETLRAKAYESADAARKDALEAKVKEAADKYSRDTQLMVAQVQKNPTGREKVLADLSAQLANLNPGTPEFRKVQERYNAIDKSIAAATIRRPLSSMPAGLQTTYKSLLDSYKALAAFPDEYEPKQKALKDLQDMKDYLESQGIDVGPGGGGTGGAPAGTSNLPPGFVRD